MSRHSKEEQIKMYECPVCPRTFRRAACLVNHMNTHKVIPKMKPEISPERSNGSRVNRADAENVERVDEPSSPSEHGRKCSSVQAAERTKTDQFEKASRPRCRRYAQANKDSVEPQTDRCFSVAGTSESSGSPRNMAKELSTPGQRRQNCSNAQAAGNTKAPQFVDSLRRCWSTYVLGNKTSAKAQTDRCSSVSDTLEVSRRPGNKPRDHRPTKLGADQNKCGQPKAGDGKPRRSTSFEVRSSRSQSTEKQKDQCPTVSSTSEGIRRLRNKPSYDQRPTSPAHPNKHVQPNAGDEKQPQYSTPPAVRRSNRKQSTKNSMKDQCPVVSGTHGNRIEQEATTPRSLRGPPSTQAEQNLPSSESPSSPMVRPRGRAKECVLGNLSLTPVSRYPRNRLEADSPDNDYVCRACAARLRRSGQGAASIRRKGGPFANVRYYGPPKEAYEPPYFVCLTCFSPFLHYQELMEHTKDCSNSNLKGIAGNENIVLYEKEFYSPN